MHNRSKILAGLLLVSAYLISNCFTQPIWGHSEGSADACLDQINLHIVERTGDTKTNVNNSMIKINYVTGHRIVSKDSFGQPRYSHHEKHNLNPELIYRNVPSEFQIHTSEIRRSYYVAENMACIQSLGATVYKVGYRPRTLQVTSGAQEIVLAKKTSSGGSAAQSTPPPANAEASQVSINVQFLVNEVFDPAMGTTLPVAGALVALQPILNPPIPFRHETRTDADGKATLTAPKRDIYTNRNSDGTTGSILRYNYEIKKADYQTISGAFDATSDKTINATLEKQ